MLRYSKRTVLLAWTLWCFNQETVYVTSISKTEMSFLFWTNLKDFLNLKQSENFVHKDKQTNKTLVNLELEKHAKNILT